MKDPAFLFYPSDWMGGTQWLTMEQKGCYLELLILQFNTGKFTESQAKQVLSICFNDAWPVLKQKFLKEGNLYFNERLKYEIDRRKSFTESRRKNGLKPKKTGSKKDEASGEHMLEHMGNRNETGIVFDSSVLDNGVFDFFMLEQNTQWIQATFSQIVTAQKKNVSFERFKELLHKFCSEKSLSGALPKNEYDYRGHFINWANIQVDKPENQIKKDIPRTLQLVQF
jgi:uncharacterized protein YdaU (DUF1376 family)